MSKGHALAAVRTIAEHLPVAVEDPSDLRAREAKRASLQAGLAFTNVVRRGLRSILELELSPGGDAEGLAVCSRILERRPGTGVVVLSTFLDEQLVAEALRRGAQAYVLKDVDLSELVRIIRAVARGESGFDSRSATVVRALAAGLPATSAEDGLPALTEREREVVGLIAEGLTNREIGQTIFVSESTVKFHVRNIMGKLDVHHRAEVAYVASRLGLLEHA